MDDEGAIRCREEFSQKRLNELEESLKEISELESIDNLTIFSAGSFARLEGGEYSDIDIFFLTSTPRKGFKNPNTTRIRLFGKVIEIVVDKLGFPKFSNDGEYLKVLHTDDMIIKLGGQHDDYENHFTTRMLLLLESKLLYGREIYDDAIQNIVNTYFRDYAKHREDFKCVFLINDIIRFWKTLCLA
jgi:predicted nucleotidyltransferase